MKITFEPPILVWFRQDLRCTDHPALVAAAATGRPVVPVFILDDETPARWRRGWPLVAPPQPCMSRTEPRRPRRPACGRLRPGAAPGPIGADAAGRDRRHRGYVSILEPMLRTLCGRPR